MSNNIRSADKKQRKVLQARQQAKMTKINTMLANYDNALLAAYTVGQALHRPPQTPGDVEQIRKALLILIELGKLGVVPGPVVTGCQTLDKLMGAALGKGKVPACEPGQIMMASGLIVPEGAAQPQPEIIPPVPVTVEG